MSRGRGEKRVPAIPRPARPTRRVEGGASGDSADQALVAVSLTRPSLSRTGTCAPLGLGPAAPRPDVAWALSGRRWESPAGRMWLCRFRVQLFDRPAARAVAVREHHAGCRRLDFEERPRPDDDGE